MRKSSSWLWPLLSKFQKHKDDCAHFCGLLRKAELYEAWTFFQVQQNRQIETMRECITMLNILAYLISNLGRHGNLIFSCLLFALFEKMCSMKSFYFSNHGILIEKTKPDGFLISLIAQCTMVILSIFFLKLFTNHN